MPSIALALIAKNERENFPRLLASVSGCFDTIFVTDTGSTDGTVEYVESKEASELAKAPIIVSRFQWIDDFSAARNHAFQQAYEKHDFVMWLDLDDELVGRDKFIAWRDSVMDSADYWLATYHYAFDAAGNPNCSFSRERVVRSRFNLQWKYPVHEGIMPHNPIGTVQGAYCPGWQVAHRRSAQDAAKDKKRNLKILEKLGPNADARMQYYLGKELFENQRPMEAFPILLKACASEELEMHDRIMGYQYACFAAGACNQWERAVEIAHLGLQLQPHRAEFHVAIADAYIKMGKQIDAMPWYAAAKTCVYQGNAAIQGAIYQHPDFYGVLPRTQLARIHFHRGHLEEAKKELYEAAAFGPCAEVAQLLAEIERIDETQKGQPAQHAMKVRSPSIAIVCTPQAPYEFDETVMQSRGIGGSETAVVEVARALAVRGFDVQVFAARKKTVVHEHGEGKVTYRPYPEGDAYFQEQTPQVVITWRHAYRYCEAPHYVWCHDLHAPGLENLNAYDFVFALSDFHSKYLESMVQVPSNRIIVTRNGVDPSKFHPKTSKKCRVVWPSSPDRGLDNAVRILERVREQFSDLELHVFYGFDNMVAAGRGEEAMRLQKMIQEKPWITFWGNVTKEKLYECLATARVWLYPTNFMETFCITALEAGAHGAIPVVRKYGAAAETCERFGLSPVVIDLEPTAENDAVYAEAVCNALREERDTPKLCEEKISWQSLGDEWIELLGLKK